MPQRQSRGIWGRIADTFIPGNAYNSNTRTWNPTQTKVGVASLIGGLLVPGLGQVINQGSNRGLFGSKLKNLLAGEQGKSTGGYDFNANPIPNGRTPDTIGGITREIFSPDTRLTIGQLNPSIRPSNSTLTISPDPTGDVNLGTATGNIFSGGSLGSWANNTATRRSSGRMNSPAFHPGAGTGYGVGVVQNDSWGDAASSFGVGGMSGGSRDEAISMPKWAFE